MKTNITTLYYKVYSIDDQEISNINYVIKIVYNGTMIVDVKELRDPQMKKCPRITMSDIHNMLYQEFNPDVYDWYKHAPAAIARALNRSIGSMEYVKYYQWFGDEHTNTHSYLTNRMLKVIKLIRIALSK